VWKQAFAKELGWKENKTNQQPASQSSSSWGGGKRQWPVPSRGHWGLINGSAVPLKTLPSRRPDRLTGSHAVRRRHKTHALAGWSTHIFKLLLYFIITTMSSSATEFIIMEDVDDDDTTNPMDAAFDAAVDDHDTMDNENELASLALAKQLMAEEAMSSYANAMALLQQSDLSNEDFALVLQTMNEDHGVDHEDAEDNSADAADDGTTNRPNGNNNGDHYETLLQLGDRIGNVKTERWRLNAPIEIAKLPTMIYYHQQHQHGSSSSSSSANTTSCADHHHVVDHVEDAKCLVCQCDYDNGDALRQLPCSHTFHQECVDPWLMDHDVCPSCREPIVVDVDVAVDHATMNTTMSD
jgi:hypothetical protein